MEIPSVIRGIGLALAALVAGCSEGGPGGGGGAGDGGAAQAGPEAMPAPSAEAGYRATVEEITVENREGRVTVKVAGSVLDACTRVTQIRQAYGPEQQRFTLQPVTSRPQDALCAQVLTPFEREVTLETADLPPGRYEVAVAGVTGGFELSREDQAPPAASLRAALLEDPGGRQVLLTAHGLPAQREVQVGAGPVNSEYGILATAITTADGALETRLALPDHAAAGRRWVMVIELPDGDKVISNEITVQAPAGEGG